jgi:hypothetical protein
MLLSQVVGIDVMPATEPVSEAETEMDADVEATPVAPYGLWDRLAMCESSGNWSAVSPDRNHTYRGGLQFDQPTWHAYGGGQYAASAHLASKTQQIAVAERLRAARGMAPWPVCGKRV